MIAVYVVAGFIVWWVSGIFGFVYWWTSDYDLDSGDLAVGLLVGAFLGPSAWLVGRAVHSHKSPRVIVRKRGT